MSLIFAITQESVRKFVVSKNYMWGTAFTMTGFTAWSFRRYNYQSRLIALPFVFYGGTFVGRMIGDVMTGRNAESDRDRFLGQLPGKVYYDPEAAAAAGPKKTMNSAFVFVKPHAVNDKVNQLVSTRLTEKGFKVTGEGTLTSEVIDSKKLIDQHYYAIASKATILKPKELNVPKDKFKNFFGLEWEEALKKNMCFNALDACKEFGCDSDQLAKAWAESQKAGNLVKFGGGFYCGKVNMNGKELLVFNAFFMSMRGEFTKPGRSIHWYTVEWDAAKLSWEDFRGKVLGPTNPKDAPKDSLRGEIMNDWKKLGLKSEPNVGDNGVHASASPFEGLAERMNWLGKQCKQDSYCKSLVAAGIKEENITAWSVDPQVKIDASGKKGSLFDQLEDMDAQACLDKCKALQSM